MRTMRRSHHSTRKEDRRFNATRVLAWGGWLGAFALTVVLSLDVVPDDSVSSRVLLLAIILLMGAGIAAGLSLSRQKLTSTIVEVFVTGLETATTIRGRKEDTLRKMHVEVPRGDTRICQSCGQTYPCETLRVLDS